MTENPSELKATKKELRQFQDLRYEKESMLIIFDYLSKKLKEVSMKQRSLWQVVFGRLALDPTKNWEVNLTTGIIVPAEPIRVDVSGGQIE